MSRTANDSSACTIPVKNELFHGLSLDDALPKDIFLLCEDLVEKVFLILGDNRDIDEERVPTPIERSFRRRRRGPDNESLVKSESRFRSARSHWKSLYIGSVTSFINCS